MAASVYYHEPMRRVPVASHNSPSARNSSKLDSTVYVSETPRTQNRTKRYILYGVLIVGYIISAILVTLFIYQKLLDQSATEVNVAETTTRSDPVFWQTHGDYSTIDTDLDPHYQNFYETDEEIIPSSFNRGPSDLSPTSSEVFDYYAPSFSGIERVELDIPTTDEWKTTQKATVTEIEASGIVYDPSFNNSMSSAEFEESRNLTPSSTTTKMTTSTTTRSVKKPKMCLKDECVLSSSNIIRLMNRNADPCSDFQEFACGRYGDTTAGDQQPSPWSSATIQLSQVRFPDQYENTYKFLVERTLESDSSTAMLINNASSAYLKFQDGYLKKIRIFYASCMHQSSFTKYLTDLKMFLFGIGRMAIRSTDMTKIVGELMLRDVFPLFAFSVYRPPLGDGRTAVDGRLALTAPTRHLHPFTLQPSSSMTSTYLKIDSLVDLLAEEFSTAFGIEKSSISDIDKLMEASRLRNLYGTTFIRQNRDCEAVVLIDNLSNELGNFTHLFNWSKLMDYLLPDNNRDGKIKTVCMSKEFRRYMLSIEQIFENVTRMELLFYSTIKAGQHLINYWTVFEEHGSSFSRRSECYKLLETNFREFVAEIVRNHLISEEFESLISEITSRIRQVLPEFSSVALSSTSLEDISKVHSIIPEYLNTSELIRMHGLIPDMKDSSFLPNVLSAWRFRNLRELFKVGYKKVNTTYELDLALSLKAQAAFVPKNNEIRIYPLLLGLTSPELGFSGSSLPKPYLYGTLGFAIAHEFAHVLQYYEHQTVRRDSKLVSNYLSREERRKDCLSEENLRLMKLKTESITQEDYYYMSDASDSYLNELWADVVALKLAYQALEGSVELEPLRALPGLQNLTWPQLFFVSFSQVFCSRQPPSHLISASMLRRQLRFGQIAASKQFFVQYSQNQLSHPPNFVRSSLPLSLLRNQFSSAFSCQSHSGNNSRDIDDNCS